MALWSQTIVRDDPDGALYLDQQKRLRPCQSEWHRLPRCSSGQSPLPEIRLHDRSGGRARAIPVRQNWPLRNHLARSPRSIQRARLTCGPVLKTFGQHGKVRNKSSNKCSQDPDERSPLPWRSEAESDPFSPRARHGAPPAHDRHRKYQASPSDHRRKPCESARFREPSLLAGSNQHSENPVPRQDDATKPGN